MHNYYLFIKWYAPLYVSSLKCSSSGGYTVYMQYMVLSLFTRVTVTYAACIQKSI
jgi:hypothetical protein